MKMADRRFPATLGSLIAAGQIAPSRNPAVALRPPLKRKVFVSYHHDSDQTYYDTFSRLFVDQWGVVTDNSLERFIDSDDSDYVMRRIRENYIIGTSCTIVLCGRDTPERKYVDWEIKASLDDAHGLLGIALPTARRTSDQKVIVPGRLLDNWTSGFAAWTYWGSLIANPSDLTSLIDNAVGRRPGLIINSRALRRRNG